MNWIEFDLFQIFEVFWLFIASAIFFRSFSHNLKIGEIRPFMFCVLSINVYIFGKIIAATINLFTKHDLIKTDKGFEFGSHSVVIIT
jgi:hypothetical protein